MPARFSLSFAFCLFLAAACAAQDAAEVRSYFKVVNATGDKENLAVLLNNEALHPRGIASGVATGLLGLPPGSHSFKAKHPTDGEVSFVLEAKPDAMTSVVFHLHVEESKDGKPPKTELAYRLINGKLPDSTEDHSLYMLQVTNVKQLEVKIGNTPYTLDYEKPFEIPLPRAAGMFPRVAFRNFSLGSLNLEFPEDRVAIFFTDREGTLKMIEFGNEAKKRR